MAKVKAARKGSLLVSSQDSCPVIPDQSFLDLATSWMQDQAELLLGFVWQAYDIMRSHPPQVNSEDLERSITQLLEPRIKDAMSGDEPFYVQHGPYERETKMPAPAQPPQYDLAFVLRSDETVMWPLEAKVLETSRRVAQYIADVNDEFLTCRYAPFSDAGAMLGYLISGSGSEALNNLASALSSSFEEVPSFKNRHHRKSFHQRTVPDGKTYSSNFCCHHLILEYPDLMRS